MKQSTSPSLAEFVTIMALLMALVALSSDIVLPALHQMGVDLDVKHENDTQLVISLIFLGIGCGQLFFGPLSDSIGRKPAMSAGVLLFLFGCGLSMTAQGFTQMSIGRFLQGLGLASARTVSLALIRDVYVGPQMARVMSFIMMIFIMVPMLAPMIGQGLLHLVGWRGIFAFAFMMGVFSLTWFVWRLPETLVLEKRKAFTLRVIALSTAEVLKSPVAMSCTLIAGVVFSSFMAYLSTAQQILQLQYGLGDWFPPVFAFIAMFGGIASYTNGRIVVRFGMQVISRMALLGMLTVSLVVLSWMVSTTSEPPLWAILIYFSIIFYSVSTVFGNINAMAMESLGHIAGVAASVVGSISMILAFFIGVFIARQYDGSVKPLVIGFICCSTASLVLLRRAAKTPPQSSQ